MGVWAGAVAGAIRMAAAIPARIHLRMSIPSRLLTGNLFFLVFRLSVLAVNGRSNN
jgi:hypothetical protein